LGDAGETALWRWQHAQTAPARFSVEAIEFSAIPGWQADDHGAALECYLRSPPRALKVLPRTTASVQGLLGDRGRARCFFEENFAAYRILEKPGLLTAYFEPVLSGARRRSSKFSVPVYRRPPGLRPLPEDHRLTALGLTAGLEADSSFVPYFTRAEIEAGALAGEGLEILYLEDPIEAFIMHVQGSAHVHLDDGTSVRLSFDGKNGHPYTSISKLLVARGELAVEDAHLDGLTGWLRSSSEPQLLMQENRSYIFFTELASSKSSPRGSSGAPLTAGRSVAADPRYHPYGSLLWASAPALAFDGKPLARLLVVQDTGSAIAGPQRGDVFAGSGMEAGRIAGRVRHKCEFTILRPRQ
jgi:membrane-bound lytic murein transglycosylase A